MNLAGTITIAGHALNDTPETVFLAVVLISIGLRTAFQKGVWWYHVVDRALDVLIGVVAVTTIPRFGAEVSKVTTQSWAGYGISVILAVITAILVFGKGK